MNFNPKNVNHCLYIPKENENYMDEIIRLGLECIKCGKMVLLLTHNMESIDMVSAVERFREKIHDFELKLFKIMCFKKVDDITAILLTLWCWSLLPTVIIIDYKAFIASFADIVDCYQKEYAWNTLVKRPKPLVRSICCCMATVLNYTSGLLIMKAKANDIRNAFITTVTIMQNHSKWLTSEQVQILLNLYFCNSEVHDCLDLIKEDIIN